MVYQTDNEGNVRAGGYRPMTESEAFSAFRSRTQPAPPPEAPPPALSASASPAYNSECSIARGGGLFSGILEPIKVFFSNLDTEDLLLIGIAALLLFDGKPDNDLLVILILVLLFNG